MRSHRCTQGQSGGTRKEKARVKVRDSRNLGSKREGSLEAAGSLSLAVYPRAGESLRDALAGSTLVCATRTHTQTPIPIPPPLPQPHQEAGHLVLRAEIVLPRSVVSISRMSSMSSFIAHMCGVHPHMISLRRKYAPLFEQLALRNITQNINVFSFLHQNNNKLPFFIHELMYFYEQTSSRAS